MKSSGRNNGGREARRPVRRATGARRSSGARVLVIYKKSTYQRFVLDRRDERVIRLVEDQDASVRRLQGAHEDHVATMEQTRVSLRSLGAKAVFRYLKTRSSTEGFDLVVTLGGDGTLLWASHIVGPGIPMVAINTAPRDSVGYFCAGDRDSLDEVLGEAIEGNLKRTQLTRMRVLVDGTVVSDRVLNDALFSHECPAATTRYLIYHGGIEEDHRSSGIWIGPAAGSTAALRSAGGRVMPIGSKRIQYVVREPYHANDVSHSLNRGLVQPGDELMLRSKTTAGRLYLDGPHREFPVQLGSEIRLAQSSEPLTLLGLRSRARE